MFKSDPYDIIYARLEREFGNKINKFDLSDIAFMINDDLVDHDFVDDYVDDTKATPLSDQYLDLVDALENTINDLIHIVDDVTDFAESVASALEENNKAIKFLDRDIDDLMQDLVLNTAGGCDCPACENARDTYKHVMD